MTYAHVEKEHDDKYKRSDKHTDTVSFTNYVEVFPKTELLFSYDHVNTDFPEKETGDNTADKFWLGVKGYISPKITGDMRVGYSMSDFETGKDEDAIAAKIGIDYNISERLFSRINISRDVETTTFLDESHKTVNASKLSLKYLPPFNRRLALGMNIEYENSDFASNREDELYV